LFSESGFADFPVNGMPPGPALYTSRVSAADHAINWLSHIPIIPGGSTGTLYQDLAVKSANAKKAAPVMV
jgi:hypothetical protein